MFKTDPVYFVYKLNNRLYKIGLRFIPFIIRGLMRIVFACDIDPRTKIGKGTVFPHYALGVVIGRDAIIGENCHIGQNVTIGGRSGHAELPQIGNNVLIGCGACVLGPIKIGNNVKIGAGAVVIKNVPANCIAVGVPAKITETNKLL